MKKQGSKRFPDPQRTPGGVERFILRLDKRKILRAGTTANVNAMPDDRSSANLSPVTYYPLPVL